MRGEYKEVTGEVVLKDGLPLHTWGIHHNPSMGIVVVRITPTYVGNTIEKNQLHANYGDHPHIRGEYTDAQKQELKDLGSPPHTWGIQAELGKSALKWRITPTYVGNTHHSI